jgi:hypothetical protein
MRLQLERGVLSIEVSGRPKKIGDIFNRVLKVYRNRQEHYMRKYHGYGFNAAVINDSRLFDYVLIEEINGEQKNYFLLSREDIITHGKPDQTEDFEKQLFVPLYLMQKLNQYKNAG